MDIGDDIVKLLIKHKVIDQTALMRVEYQKMRDKGMTAKKAREKLVDVFCISDSQIQYYLYHRKM